jgi:hypothetical protein
VVTDMAAPYKKTPPRYSPPKIGLIIEERAKSILKMKSHIITYPQVVFLVGHSQQKCSNIATFL